MTDNKTNMSHQCDAIAGRANQTLGCIYQGILSKAKDVILLLYLALVRPQLEYCIQFWVPHFKNDVKNLERAQRRATHMIRDLQGKPYEERLTDLGLFSLKREG